MVLNRCLQILRLIHIIFDPEDIKRKITDKTKAIVAVDYTGQPCEFDEIRKIAKEHNLILIEDAAHALGASYKGTMVGNISDMTTFSFSSSETYYNRRGWNDCHK